MARSLKKGPFADASLLKKVDAMNAAGDRSRLSRPGPAVLPFSRRWLVIQSRFMTEESTFRCMYTEDMVGHKLGEFVATRTYRGHGKDEKKSAVKVIHR